MNARYNKRTGKWICKKCERSRGSYKEASECCLPKIKVKYIPTGEITEFPFGLRVLGYSNEIIICEAFGYDKGGTSELNNPENYEIIEIEGYKKEIKQ